MPTLPSSTVHLPPSRSMEAMLGALRMPEAARRETDGWCHLSSDESFRYDYDECIARGGWEFYRLAPGLSLAITDIVATQSIPRRHFLGDHLMLSICMEGAFPIRQRSGDNTRLTSGYCAVYGLPTGEDVATVYQSGEPLKWFTVFIERGSLFDLTGLRATDLPDNINQFLQTGTRLPLAALTLSPATMLIARQIMECPFTAGFRCAYMKSKALELTCHVLFTLATNVQELHRAGVQLSTRDHRKLQQAMALIDSNLEETPDIEKLVAAVGLSRPKLQLGFRVLYGDTVARIRDKRRMEHALKLVRTTHLSMVDIAAEVGYQHPASFTRAFKAAYGDAPLKLRRAAQHSTLLGHIGKRRV